ncbi:hypothetical protein FHU41_000456 [Psychromicrobium silvestre]|uniref:Uncharacterized protein n=1 Tax=Psychromicrobium silvestre TaxID=1645614 RepID=A0A7Y9S4Z6_9MICC|nr:hypothetical protein [Psychromicrobium silvestre]NYE94235.1 hypothetical protein [Psychromicrobium silvestre]
MFSEVCTAAMARLRSQAELQIRSGIIDPRIREQMREPLIIDEGSLYFEDEIRNVGRVTLESMWYDVDREAFVNKLALDWLINQPDRVVQKPTAADFETFGVRCAAQGVILARAVLTSARAITERPQIVYITLDFEKGEYDAWFPTATFRFTAYRFGVTPGGEWINIDPKDRSSYVMSIRLE